MKIRPVILCGGAGTRLWPKKSKHQAKQFIDFGGWTLINKTFERVKSKVFDYPIISTNSKYLKEVKRALKKSKIKKYKIILEPAKKNTAPAILASALIKDVPYNQPLMYFAADHLIEKPNKLITAINKNKSNLDEKNVFIFGIKPTSPSSEYGYFITKKKKNINKVTRFIEKPKALKAKQVMGDVAGKEPFEQVAKRLLNEFLEGRNDDETQEVIGQAYLEYILKRERIRRDVTKRGQHRDAVDYETLQKLKNADSDDPTHAHAMLTFQKFGFDPNKAMEYVDRLINSRKTELSRKMAAIASNQRPRGRKPFAKIIFWP